MPLEDWFTSIDLDRPPPAQQVFLRQLAEMLDHYQPRLLDPRASDIGSGDHGWIAGKDAIVIRLAHRRDAEATIEVVVDDEEATVAWLTAHHHFYQTLHEGSLEEWASEGVGFVAAVLRGDFEVEDTFRGDELIKTRVVDVSIPKDPQWVSSTGPLTFWRFFRRPKRVERRRIDFGV